MGSFLKSFKSEIYIFNQIWWNMYFSEIQNLETIVKIHVYGPLLLCKLAQIPLNVVSPCRKFNFL